jgi:hypothetical protein
VSAFLKGKPIEVHGGFENGCVDFLAWLRGRHQRSGSSPYPPEAALLLILLLHLAADELTNLLCYALTFESA